MISFFMFWGSNGWDFWFKLFILWFLLKYGWLFFVVIKKFRCNWICDFLEGCVNVIKLYKDLCFFSGKVVGNVYLVVIKFGLKSNLFWLLISRSGLVL